LAFLNSKPKRKKFRKNFLIFKKNNSFFERQVATTGWGRAKYYIGPLEPNTPTKKIKNMCKLEILERLLS
jgi:hypothetical protein